MAPTGRRPHSTIPNTKSKASVIWPNPSALCAMLYALSFPLPPSIASQPLVEQLTERELDVLELLAQRLSYKEIADKLHVSAATVKSHIHNIYGKLKVSKRRQAVEKAKKIGIL